MAGRISRTDGERKLRGWLFQVHRENGCLQECLLILEAVWVIIVSQIVFVVVIITIHTCTVYKPFSVTTRVSQYQKDKTSLNFTETRDSEWQWHQLDHMQVCTSLQTDDNASTPSLCFLQAGCYSCHPTNSIKALKAIVITVTNWKSWKKTALF